MIELMGPICGSVLGGSWLCTSCKSLGDLLAVAKDLRAPSKLDVDDRQSDARDRAHPGDAGQAVHLGLDRKGDELLDLLRCQPLGFRHDRDGRPIEIGEHIDGKPRGGQGAEHDQHGRRPPAPGSGS